MKKINAKNTKAEILEAYEELVNNHKLLQRELRQAQSGEGAPAPAPPASDARTLQLIDPSKTLDVQAFLGALSGLGAHFGECANSLRHHLSTEAETLKELQTQIDDQLNQIRSLHDLELSEGTLNELISRYHALEQQHSTTLEASRQRFDAEMELAWLDWDRQQRDATQQLDDAKAKGKLERQREEAAYAYELNQRRSADQDAYAQQQREQREALDKLLTQRHEQWQTQEATIAQQERELVELEAKFNAAPQQLDDAVQKAKGEGAGIAKRQAKVEADILAKEHEGKRRVFELQVKSLQETIGQQANQLERLTKQLAQAQAQAQELATKAIEGAANNSSFHAIREIAMEQAKQSAKSK